MKRTIIIALLLATCGYCANAKPKHKNSPCYSVTAGHNNNSGLIKNTNYTVTEPAVIEPVSYTRHHIKVYYDNMNNPYRGLPSRQNDGVKKNEMRNLNVTATSFGADIPASDGTMPY
jgi:hypothetical protein